MWELDAEWATSHFLKKYVAEFTDTHTHTYTHAQGLILGLRPANARRRYKVTPSLIGWVQT